MLTEMSKNQRPHAVSQTLQKELRHHGIRKMPDAAHHTLLHGPGVRPYFQHVQVVIGFEKQKIRVMQMIPDRIGHVPEIHHYTGLDAVHANAETDRINCIVRHCKRADLDVTYAKLLARLETAEIRLVVAPVDGRSSEPSHVDPCFRFPQNRQQTAHMIAMLMRDQHRIERLQRHADSLQPFLDVLATQAGIDEDAGVIVADEHAVTGTAAGENADSDDAQPP